jgi:predicted DNA-binding protein YlxM (UPF0122 family)
MSEDLQRRTPRLAHTRTAVELPAQSPATPQFTISEFAGFLGLEENMIRECIAQRTRRRVYYSIGELAERWRVSRGTVYNRLRAAGTKVLDFSAPGKKGKKAISAESVLQLESKKTKKLA